MDPRIVHLKSTTFFGRRFTRKQIANIQETVATFPALSRKELAQTICEHLRWRTPAGTNRVAAALRLLETLHKEGILTLPPQRAEKRRASRKPIGRTCRTDPQPRIEADLRELTPLRLQLAASPEQAGLFNEYIDRHHYLGYRQPLGPHLRYFLLDRHGRPLGCLLFSQASRALACRDEWVGWRPGQYKQHLHLVVGQPRFLLLPWLAVENLASHALALAVKQLPQDWQRHHGCRPVLVETFVNPEHFAGTCYRAANWIHLGQTRGRPEEARRPKDVYVYALDKHCREILLHGPPKPQPKPRRSPAPEAVAPDADYVALWQELIGALSALAADHDRRWQLRRRVLNTLLVMLFVFRLVFAPRRQGYAATLAELWDHCRALDVPLPQPRPVHEAAMVRARRKIDPAVFRQFHAEILLRTEQPGGLWNGHRVFAVDGSKLTLPRPLLEAGYRLPNQAAHYPQGLLSCLYRLHCRLPVDFELHAHRNERAAALAHLRALAPGDLVVYDRGYYSFELLWAHRRAGLQAVFRLPRNVCPDMDRFIDGDSSDTTLPILPGPDTLRALSRKYAGCRWQPLPLRLVKYTHASTQYVLGTTLLDPQRYRVEELADLYHARWGVEELYKISKVFLELDQFHGRSEQLVKQELYAHFNLIAMTRSFTNRDAALCEAACPADCKPPPQANFKHSLATVSRHLEALLLRHSEFVRETVTRIAECIGIGRRRPRPNRSYPRCSKRPAPKWSRRKAALA